MNNAKMTVDDLAQVIRVVDGDNRLGAGGLAEILWPYLFDNKQVYTAQPLDYEADTVSAIRQAYDWYVDDNGINPHKETRHGGDQVARAYALGMMHAAYGKQLDTMAQVEVIRVQQRMAPEGSVG